MNKLTKKYKNIVITGAFGFIGAEFVKELLFEEGEKNLFLIDKFTKVSKRKDWFEPYLKDRANGVNFWPVQANLAIPGAVNGLWEAIHKGNGEYPDLVVHFAAESHVDTSISAPAATITNNVLSTTFLLDAVRQFNNNTRVIVVGTDEVYGQKLSLDEPASVETDKLDPRSPYSASKAASDLIALSYATTYGLDVIVTRCCNNFGKDQYPEKLIPKSIQNVVNGKPIEVYGDGENIREWIDVGMHCGAILDIINHGKTGEIYNIGSGYYETNNSIARMIQEVTGEGAGASPIVYVGDRKGHDKVYKIDSDKFHGLLCAHTGEIYTNTLTSNAVARHKLKHTIAETFAEYKETFQRLNSITISESSKA